MSFKAFQLTAAACAAAALVTACGGGGGGSAAATAPSAVVVEGTAATGLALASAPVSVKCAAGTGTATTDANGTYSITVSGGALPCLVEVNGTVNGAAVSLHSVVESGTANGTSTTARANVTPFTELIVANLLGQAPAAAFQSFTSATGITAQQVSTATAAIVAAIKEATGVDLGTIDPLKATLVAATASAPTGGNTYDKALDALAAKINTSAIPLMASQIAASGSTTSSAIAQSLSAAPGCATAVNGRYRAVGLTGNVIVGALDFKAMTVKFDGHEASAPIAQNPDQACDFSIGTTEFSATAENRFAIGTQGAGAFRGTPFLNSTEVVNGYLFPVQANTPDFAAAAAASPWIVAQTGVVTDETPQRVNWLSLLTFSADGKVSVCDYDNGTNWTGACTSDGGPTITNAVATANGVELREGSTARARFWSFRSPAGSTTLYGTTRVDPNATTTEMTSFVATRQTTQALPVVGAVTRSIGFNTNGVSTSANALTTVAPATAIFTVDSVDAAAGTYVRSGSNAGNAVTGQVVSMNKPQQGLRTLPATVFANVQMPVTGTGLTLSLRPSTATSGFTHLISVGVPTTTPAGSAAPVPTAPVTPNVL